jgi:hypothetical protein
MQNLSNFSYFLAPMGVVTSVTGCWASESLPRVGRFGGLKAVLRARTRSLSNQLRHRINSPAYGILRDKKLIVGQDQRATGTLGAT